MPRTEADKDRVFKRRDPHPERGVKSDPAQEDLKKDLDKALEETFPASDPVAQSQPTTPGAAEKRRSGS